MAEFYFLETLKSVLGSSKTHYFQVVIRLARSKHKCFIWMFYSKHKCFNCMSEDSAKEMIYVATENFVDIRKHSNLQLKGYCLEFWFQCALNWRYHISWQHSMPVVSCVWNPFAVSRRSLAAWPFSSRMFYLWLEEVCIALAGQVEISRPYHLCVLLEFPFMEAEEEARGEGGKGLGCYIPLLCSNWHLDRVFLECLESHHSLFFPFHSLECSLCHLHALEQWT